MAGACLTLTYGPALRRSLKQPPNQTDEALGATVVEVDDGTARQNGIEAGLARSWVASKQRLRKGRPGMVMAMYRQHAMQIFSTRASVARALAADPSTNPPEPPAPEPSGPGNTGPRGQ